VLAARDLQDEQLANRQQHRQLGRAIGAGVVDGMEVELVVSGSPSVPPVLSVRGGLAINRSGQVIELDVDQVQVALARKLPALAEAGLFADCEPLQSTPDLVGKGVYLFTIAPASTYRDQAPMVSLNGGGKADGCGDRYKVEGAVFRLFEVPLDKLGLGQAASAVLADLMSKSEQSSLPASARTAARSRLRNLLAHACFGTEALAAFSADPLRRVAGASPYSRYGALDALRAAELLTDCEVPLALLLWTSGGVRFVDMWAVRRRPTREPLSSTWPLPASERLAAENEALFQQFQAHLADIASQGSLQAGLTLRKARDFFIYMPPASCIPIAYNKGTRSFVSQTFFDGVTVRGPLFIEGARITPLLRQAAEYPPLDITKGVMLWLYAVREDIQTIEASVAAQSISYLIAVSGHVPFAGEARFDVNRWEYANFS
jgi:hypothetical protein